MSALIRNRQVENNDFVPLDDNAMPTSGKVITSLERWKKDPGAFNVSGLTVGVLLPNTSDIDQVWPWLKDLPLIALEFPAFGDGRAYSQARILRDRYHFRGEIRATGAAVVRDQLFGMNRCGINAFELRTDQDLAACLAAFDDFSLAYQAAADTLQVAPKLRSN